MAGEFTRAILGNALELDVEAARADNVAAARDLRAGASDLGAIVLECTNMVPYCARYRGGHGAAGLFDSYAGQLVPWRG